MRPVRSLDPNHSRHRNLPFLVCQATDRYPSSNGYSAGKLPTRAPSGCYPLKRPALREPEESFAIGYGYDRSAAIAAILTGYRVHRWGDEAVIGALEVNRLQ